jgi:hypothetical protein
MKAASRSVVLAAIVAMVAIVAAALGPPAGAVPRSEDDYTTVPAPPGGDIRVVSSVYGPALHQFWFGVRRASRSDSLESFSSTEFHLQYGLSRRASLGVTGLFLKDDMGEGPTGLPVNKQGAGDTRVFLKWVAPVGRNPNLALGLRPGLRVPTGYDREGDGLVAFTTGTIDFDLLGLLAYETPMLGVYLNPGISLPGGKWHNEILGGLGIDLRGGLPLGLLAKAEYFSRYDMVDDRFRHEAFGALERELFMGLALEVGYRKQLVHGEDPGAEFTLGITRGRLTGLAPATLHAPVVPVSAHIEVSEVGFARPDPDGMSTALRERLVRELSGREGLSASLEDRKADYTAHLEILSVAEGNGRSISIPRVLATPQIVYEVAAQVTVYDMAGKTVMDRQPLGLRLTRGTGLRLFPPTGDEDRWVPTAQTRIALRSAAVDELARRAADELSTAVRRDQAAKAAAQSEGDSRSGFGRGRGISR